MENRVNLKGWGIRGVLRRENAPKRKECLECEKPAVHPRTPNRPHNARRASKDPTTQETPCASATSWPPAGWPRSTLGDGGLNCRVRDGTG